MASSRLTDIGASTPTKTILGQPYPYKGRVITDHLVAEPASMTAWLIGEASGDEQDRFYADNAATAYGFGG